MTDEKQQVHSTRAEALAQDDKFMVGAAGGETRSGLSRFALGRFARKTREMALRTCFVGTGSVGV